MKLYLNVDLDVQKLSEVFNKFAELSLKDVDYVKYGVLKSKKLVQEFVTSLAGESKIYFYDYVSLQLTLSEFGTLYHALNEKDIEIFFLNETVEFTQSLVKILSAERNVFSKRVTLAIDTAREQGKTIGRPKLKIENRDKICYLYTHKKMSMRQIAQACDVSLGTVHKYINAARDV